MLLYKKLLLMTFGMTLVVRVFNRNPKLILERILDKAELLESHVTDGTTKCRKLLPNWLIQKNCHARARHRCDWKKKTGEAMAREQAKQS